jgi:acetolactate synthase-1/2/3 large subunit
MDNPDFQVVAEGFRIKTNRVIKREKLDVALDEFLTADSSFFLEIMVGKENNVFPMVPSGKCVSDIRLE